MKRYLLITILFLSVEAKAQWEIMHDNEDFTLSSVYFVNDSTGFAVGGRRWTDGVIMKTTDRGQTWFSILVNNKLNCVYFSSKDTGYAVGENATIMKTVDGGTNWVYQNSGILTDFEITSVYFTDNNTGYATPVNGPSGAFLKTTDGGITWQNISNNVLGGWAVYFPSKNVGYIIRNSIFKTTDGGLNWVSYPIPENFFGSLYFLNDTLGYSAGFAGVSDSCNNNSSIIKTTDGGLSWQNQIFNCTNSFHTIYFPCKNIGYVGGFKHIFKTENGGNSWYLQSDSIISNTWIFSIFCTDSVTCYAVGDNGRILKTINGGGVLGFENTEKINSISIYPNPTTDNFIIDIPEGKMNPYSLQLFDVTGRLIKEECFICDEKHIVDVSNFKSGLYFIKLTGSKCMYQGKLIKQ